MKFDTNAMEFIVFLMAVAGGFYRLTKIESNILSEIANVNKRLEVHFSDHKLIDREIDCISRKLDC